MKYILGIASLLCTFVVASAQCGSSGSMSMGGCGSMSHGPMMAGGYMGSSMQMPTIFRTVPQSELDAEELAFARKAGVRQMTEALARSSTKPVICLMGPDALKDPAMQRIAMELKDVATVAWMARDGNTVNAKGEAIPAHRIVAWSNGVYGADTKAAYIPASKLTDKSADKLLAFARGGSAK